MQPHGYLILGSTETLTEGTSHFETKRFEKTYYFGKKGAV
jgi:chemotaxis methyl-accepting protein methylase